jgi:hypothetical protein
MAAAAAGAQTSPGERESARARVVSRERRREGRGDWKFQICLLLDAGPGANQLRFFGMLYPFLGDFGVLYSFF